MSFACRPCKPRRWAGYYRRIPGAETAFHVPSNVRGSARPFVYWTLGTERGRCDAVKCRGATVLADAVNAAKRALGGTGGGSFLIDEEGRVLVPAPDGSGRVALAGEVSGRLVFENPFAPGELLDLADDKGLRPGDPWDRPYVGMWYNLSKRNRLYCLVRTTDGVHVEYLDGPELVRLLRRLRPWGAIRFIINPHGIVLTKVPSPRGLQRPWEQWSSVYVTSVE